MATMYPERSGAAASAVTPLALRRSRTGGRRFALVGLVMVAAIAYLIVSSFSSAVTSVVSPSQLLVRGSAAIGQTLRLQGQVVGAAAYSPVTLTHAFRVSDGHHTVFVVYGSDLPGGFKTGASVEAQGSYDGSQFTATTLTAKCPTKYQAPASGSR